MQTNEADGALSSAPSTAATPSAQPLLRSPSTACSRKRKSEAECKHHDMDEREAGESKEEGERIAVEKRRRCLRVDPSAAVATDAPAPPPIRTATHAATLTPLLRPDGDGSFKLRMKLQVHAIDDAQPYEPEGKALAAGTTSWSSAAAADAALDRARCCKRKDVPAHAQADEPNVAAEPGSWLGEQERAEDKCGSGWCKRLKLMEGATEQSAGQAQFIPAQAQHHPEHYQPSSAADECREQEESGSDAEDEHKEQTVTTIDDADRTCSAELGSTAAACADDLIDDADQSMLSALSLSDSSAPSSPTIASAVTSASPDIPADPSHRSHANGCCAATATLLRQNQQLRQALAAEHSLRRSAERQLQDIRMRGSVVDEGPFATGGASAAAAALVDLQDSPSSSLTHQPSYSVGSFMSSSAFACSPQYVPYLFPNGLSSHAARQLMQSRQWQPQRSFYS